MTRGTGAYGDELVAVLDAALEALRDLPASVHRLTGAELGAVLTVVDEVGALSGAGRFTITAEAVERGEVAASQAGSTQQWVADRCPSLDAREAGVVAKAVRELADPRLAPVRGAVSEGRLSAPAACVVASEWRQLMPLVEPDAEAAVVAGLVAIGVSEGVAGVRGLRPALLARYGLGQQLQDLEDRHRGLTMLSCGRDIGGGITEYRMRLATEARSVVEAAINAASAPRPVDGERDHRTVEQRRGDALVDVCRRAVAYAGSSRSAGAGGRDGGAVLPPPIPPSGVKATVMVTISLEDLQDRSRAGVVVGGVDAGTLLGPETVRRLTCDGALVPVVVGADGQILYFGRTKRWFTSAQVRALWLRDRHCTFPGCRAPASWCDAHHIRHWVDGGPTDLTNGALLCERHHTVVHRDRLTATVTGAEVTWDRAPGSYDRALARGPTARPAA
ncbi:MAG TPA: DUF222 domain-containing protein [Lapillicoccus sp.]|nr:DUF222 domain-containing protein [Lapillicoccus sp.]